MDRGGLDGSGGQGGHRDQEQQEAGEAAQHQGQGQVPWIKNKSLGIICEWLCSTGIF